MAHINTNAEHDPVVTTQPMASPKPASRKVSIASDPVADSRYDNLAYEPCTKRKTSQVNKWLRNKLIIE